MAIVRIKLDDICKVSNHCLTHSRCSMILSFISPSPWIAESKDSNRKCGWVGGGDGRALNLSYRHTGRVGQPGWLFGGHRKGRKRGM